MRLAVKGDGTCIFWKHAVYDDYIHDFLYALSMLQKDLYVCIWEYSVVHVSDMIKH